MAFDCSPNPHLRETFIDAMSRVASAVHVVTTDGSEGRAGVTVTAMSSVSADGPAPELLICLHKDGATCAKVLRNQTFCVNLLRNTQSDLADLYAGRASSELQRMRSAKDWVPMGQGLFRLPNPLAAFGCRIRHAELVGTHYVIFGAVEEVYVSNPDTALIYANRGYAMVPSPAAIRRSA
jgi:flavin reductase